MISSRLTMRMLALIALFLALWGVTVHGQEDGEANIRIASYISWSPDGQVLAMGGRIESQAMIWLHDRITRMTQSISIQGSSVSALNWSPDGNYLAVLLSLPGVSNRLAILTFDRNTRQFSETIIMSEEFVGYTSNLLEWSPDSRYVALYWGVHISVFRAHDATLQYRLYSEEETGTASLVGIAWSGDSRFIYSGYINWMAIPILVWEVETQTIYRKIETPYINLLSLSINPAHSHLAIGDSLELAILDLADNTIKQTFKFGEYRLVTSLLWSPLGDFVLGIEPTGTIYIWDLTADNVNVITFENFTIRDATFNSFGGQLAINLFPKALPSGTSASTTVPNRNDLLNVHIIVPIATLERFVEIAASCNAPANLTQLNSDTTAQSLLTSLDALPDGAIPLGCKADLRAIAEAIRATE